MDNPHASTVAVDALFEKVGQAVFGVLYREAVEIQFRADGKLSPSQFPEHLVLDPWLFVQELIPGCRRLGIEQSFSHFLDDGSFIGLSLCRYGRGAATLWFYLVVVNRCDVAD